MTLYRRDLAQPVRLLAGKRSKYRHTFGGPPRHKGLRFRGREARVHLLYDLDLDDPLVPIKLPRAGRLPLYYPFAGDVFNIGYQVLADDEVRVLSLDESYGDSELDLSLPHDEFPDKAFPEMPVKLEPIEYQAYRAMVLAGKQNEFGMLSENMSEADEAQLRQLDWPASFAQLGGLHWLIQGPPESVCPNPECKCHEQEWPRMVVFAVIWDRAIPGFSFWYNDYVQMIFEICTECLSIQTTNACD